MGCSTDLAQTNQSTDLQSIQSASQLAHLLQAAPQYGLFLQLTDKIYADARTGPLLHQLASMQSAYFSSFNEETIAAVQAKLESIPLMQEYRSAEQQILALFQKVDQVISQAAGIPFAENALSSGHG